MKLSLIQTASTRGRELVRFIEALNQQVIHNSDSIQYIFVDQGDNSHFFSEIKNNVDFVYIKTERCSLSHARNLGLDAVSGDIVSFPDDDCWYPNGIISDILCWFENNEYDGCTGRVTNENGIPYNRYSYQSRLLTKEEHAGASSICMFLKYDQRIRFDENIGVGSPYGIGSGEETDYLSRYIALGKKVLYRPNLVVHHPISLLNKDEQYIAKTYSYAIGAGYVAKKNNYSLSYKIKMIIRPLVGMIVFFIRGDRYMVKRSRAILYGRFKGLNKPTII